MLELVGVDADAALYADWGARVERVRRRLRWPDGPAAVVRVHGHGASLAIPAPWDALFTATEANEWALCSALYARDPVRWRDLGDALAAAAVAAQTPGSAIRPEIGEEPALRRLEGLAAIEARPLLRPLIESSEARALPWLLDDEWLSIGTGAGGRDLRLDGLPSVSEVPWAALSGVPAALVTGSNGKTTIVRLIAACLRAHGLRTGFSCTDGLFIDGDAIEAGDYSGPVGARTVLRDRRIEAAVLETARGGILRRGVAVSRADVAVVANVSADHFGEYGIHDLAALADVKLTVAAAVASSGLLVLNADDETLLGRSATLRERFGRVPTLGWFALDADHRCLAANRAGGGATCGVRAGRVVLTHAGVDHDLGAVGAMPLTVDGRATYNVANLCAAALAAVGLGVAPATIGAVLAGFGSDPFDNPGRLMRFDRGGVRVLVDYAHNPEGMRGLLRVASGLRGESGRIGMLLGHAGNREDADIARLAAVAAGFTPDLVVVKEIEGFLRGRDPGEVPAILRQGLLQSGLPESAIVLQPTEISAARHALEWARPGDVLVLLVHALAARAAVLELLREGGRSPI